MRAFRNASVSRIVITILLFGQVIVEVVVFLGGLVYLRAIQHWFLSSG